MTHEGISTRYTVDGQSPLPLVMQSEREGVITSTLHGPTGVLSEGQNWLLADGL